MTRTNAFGLLTVVIRALALWLAVSGGFSIVTALATGSAQEWGVGPFLAIFGVLIGFAGGLWLFADVLARLTLASPTTPLFESDLAVSEWQRLAFSCIGLWFAATGLLDVAEEALRWVIARRMTEDHAIDVELPWAPDLAIGVLRFVLGVALLFGARGLVSLVARMRGREPPASERAD